MNALNFGVKRSKFKVKVEYAGTVSEHAEAYIGYSTSPVELDFLNPVRQSNMVFAYSHFLTVFG